MSVNRVTTVCKVNKSPSDSIFSGARKFRRRRLTSEEQLFTDIFRGYDTDARGMFGVFDTVTVNIEFFLMRVQKLVSITCRNPQCFKVLDNKCI